MPNFLEMGAITLVRGLLKGMGRETACELLARRRPLPGGNPSGIRRFEYTQFSIVQAPADCPDGDYTLTTEDSQVLPVVKLRGLWMIQEDGSSAGSRPRECA